VRKAKADPVWVENILLTVVRKLMDKVNLPLGNPDRIQSITIQNVIKPTKKLFKMNNVPLSWTRINNIISDENDVMDKSKGYEREHIQKYFSRVCVGLEQEDYGWQMNYQVLKM